MREENLKEFEVSNIPHYHNNDIKGKGIKIAIFEDIDDKDRHGLMVKGVIEQVAPEAEIIVQDKYLGSTLNDCEYMRVFVDRCIEEKVDVITCSYCYSLLDKRLEYVNKAINAGIKFFQSAGNDNKNIPTKDLRYHCPEMVIVSAVTYHDINKRVERASYSSYDDRVDVAGFTNIWTTSGTKGTGTSTSTPFNAAMYCLLLQACNKDKELTDKLYFSNVIDLGDVGKDVKYGIGLPVLPDLSKLESDTDMIILDSQITKNFKISDIACKDKNRTVLINEDVLAHARRLQKFREWYSRPMIVNSWYRTLAYNRSIKSEDTSQHVDGVATDIGLPADFKTFTKTRQNEFLKNVQTRWYIICMEDGIAGGVGFYDTFFHLDSRPTNQAFWDKRGVK